MSNKNNLLIQFWFSFILFLVILFVSNGVFTRSFSFSGFNYTGKHSAPTIIKHSPKEKHLQGKEIKIKFQMKVNSVTNYDNVFQTASGNFGIRMELGGSTEKSLGMVIGKKKARFKGFLLSNNLSPGKWHDILVQITSDQKVTVYLDNVLAIDEACSKLSYDLSDIAIGTGFSRSRPFDGEIRDFSINGKYSYKFFSLIISILLQLFASIFFVFSLFLVKDKIAELLRLLKFKASIFYSNFVTYCKQPIITKYVKFILLFILPVLLIVFSSVKILTYPHFVDAIKPDTLKYIGVLLFSFIVLIVLLDRFKKSFFIIFVPFLIVIIAGHAYALFGLVLFIFASLSLGLFLWSSFLPGEHNSNKIGYACFIGLVVNSYLIWGALHFKVNYPIVYYFFLTAQVLIFRKTLFINLHNLIQRIHAHQFTLAQKILVFLMTVHVVYALVPIYCWDELVAHFYIPKVVSLNGLFNFSPHYTSAFFNLSFVSMGANSALFIIGRGEFGVRLFYWMILYIALFIFEGFVRYEYGKRVSLFAILTLATTPYFLWIIACPFVDSLALFSAVIIFINITFLIKNYTSKNIFLFFVLSCFAIFFKLQIVFLLIPAVLIVLFKAIYAAYKHNDFKYLKVSLFGCLFVFIFFFPILLHNWIITKNPIFPMYNDLIKSPFYPTVKPLPGFFKFESVKLGWNSLYDITFAGGKYYVGGDQFLFGISYFIFLWFAPILLFCREHKKQLLLIFSLFGTAILLCYFITGPIMRYFITSAPMGVIVIGFIINKLLTVNSISRLRFHILYWAFIGVFILNFICQINISSYLPSPYPLKEAIFRNYSVSPQLKKWQDIKNFFAEVNKRYDRKTKALLYYSPAMYFADFNIEVLDWYNQFTGMEILRKYNSIDDLYFRIFKEQKFDILIITDDRPATFLDEFIKKGMVKKGYSSAGYSVYTPLKQF